MSNKPIIKTAEQIENIRIAWKHLTTLLGLLKDETKAGVKLKELEKFAQGYITKHNLKGSFKWYGWFPANLCLSNNDCLVHGIPNNDILVNGDVLKIDCWITYKKWIADSAITVIVWWEHTNPEGTQLVEATKAWLDECLAYIKPGNSIWEWSSHIQDHIESKGFSIIKHLTWHGVWVSVHEAPHIYNRRHPSTKKEILKPWMIIALEPITAITSDDFREWNNHRNLYTTNGDIGAQWEYTVLVTEDGYEVLAGMQ
jgi:methionyl aminopeptidase